MFKNGMMKPGDWICASCGDHQFARNTECRKCGAAATAGGGGKGGGGFFRGGKKAGDWNCPKCNDLQFAKNAVCRKCSEPNPDPEGSKAAMEAGIAAGHGGQEMKPGDWFCPNCNDLQFAKNKKCRKCKTANPDPEGSLEAAAASDTYKPKDEKEMKPGDWKCKKCGDHQFARNPVCRKCGAPNPSGGKGKGGGKGMGNMMKMMGGGMDNMVMIPQDMLQMMMGAMMGGGGGNMMGNGCGKGGKAGGKGGSKGKGKASGCKWCALGQCWGCKGNRSSPF